MSSSPPESPIPLAAGFPAADDAQWRTLVEKVLKGADIRRRLVSRTADGIEIEPLYVRTDAASSEERPGQAPFTRGTGVRLARRGWRIAQIRTEASPAALAAAAGEDIDGGADAITLRLAAPGQAGLPADFRAIEAALEPLPIDRVHLALEPGAHAIHGALSLATIARRRGALGRITRLGIDPLGTLARTGELVVLRRDGKSLATGVPWLPSPGTTLMADARPYHEAGASEAQEIAALAATLVAYLRALEGEGLAPSNALPRIALAMAADADIVLTIAKLRAARRVVARIAQACGAPEAGGTLQLSVTTSARMMARRDPWVNMLRVTAACAAAAMGGADEIAVLPFTWALGAPDAFAARAARNVGLVLREEAGLGRIVDPAGGAWAVEQLTDELASKAWGLFQEWESEGGMQAALTSGLVQDQIGAVADARAQDIATRRIELTGVSAFPQLGADGVKGEPWPAAPPLPLAPLARPLRPRRLAEPFEALRDAADKVTPAPRVFLASLGTPAEHGARALWITSLLAAGGIGVIAGDGFTSSTDAGRAFAESGARVACICGTDESYALLGEATAMALKAAGAAKVYLAGRPRDQEAALSAAGVYGFWHAGMDVVAALRALHGALGVGGM
jgi:methylmalonyl-CoA mutase